MEDDPYEQQSWIPKDEQQLKQLKEEIKDSDEDLQALEFLLNVRQQTKPGFVSKNYENYGRSQNSQLQQSLS